MLYSSVGVNLVYFVDTNLNQFLDKTRLAKMHIQPKQRAGNDAINDAVFGA